MHAHVHLLRAFPLPYLENVLTAPPDMPVCKAALSPGPPLLIEDLRQPSGFYVSSYTVNDSMHPISVSLISLEPRGVVVAAEIWTTTHLCRLLVMHSLLYNRYLLNLVSEHRLHHV